MSDHHYLDSIAAALPDSFKQAIRDDNKDDPHSELLNNERTFAKLWEGFSDDDRQFYYNKAGIDAAKLEQDITAIYEAADADPKQNFNRQADGREDETLLRHPPEQDEDGEDFDIVVHGTPNDEPETEDQAEARRKRYQQALQDIYEQDEKEKEEQKDAGKDKDENENGQEPKEEKKFQAAHIGHYGLRDKGDYLTLRAKGDRGQDGKRAVTDQQLRMLLLTGIMEKNWKNIQIMRGGRVDSQLTSRAKIMLGTDKFLQEALGEKANTPVIPSLTEEPPPWCKSRISQWGHRRRYNEQVRNNLREDKKSLKHGKRLAKYMEGEDGKSLAQTMNAYADGTTLVGRVKSLLGSRSRGAPNNPDESAPSTPVDGAAP